MPSHDAIEAQGVEVAYCEGEARGDCISRTDIARYRSSVPKDVVKNWPRTHDAIVLGLWETLRNPRIKGVE